MDMALPKRTSRPPTNPKVGQDISSTYSLPTAHDFYCHWVAFAVLNDASDISTCWETAKLCTATRAICLASNSRLSFLWPVFCLWVSSPLWFPASVTRGGSCGDSGERTEDGWTRFLNIRHSCSLGRILAGQRFPLVCQTSFPSRLRGREGKPHLALSPVNRQSSVQQIFIEPLS